MAVYQPIGSPPSPFGVVWTNHPHICGLPSSQKYLLIMIKKECLICGKEFFVFPYRLRQSVVKYCSSKCYGKAIKKNKLLVGNKHPFWKGGKTIHKEGYIQIYIPNHPFCVNGKYVMEHRLIAEKCLRRYLTKIEIIHHINGIVSDNRPENLYLFPSKSKHTSHHQYTDTPFLVSNLL